MLAADGSARSRMRDDAAGPPEVRPDSGARAFRHRMADGHVAVMPFRQADGRLWGPGVLDMKSGIVFFLFAVQALARARYPGAVEGRTAIESR